MNALIFEENGRLADTFFAALEQGSIDGVLACYAPHARIWHNFDQLAMTPEESLGGVRTLFENFPVREYINVRRHPTPRGLVQQHNLMLKRFDGVTIDWPGCIIFEIEDGQIVRLDEYVDLAALNS